MSSVKRGAASQYGTMKLEDICSLRVKELSADDALLIIWCPSSLLEDGLDVMKAWGFKMKQTICWVKTKKSFDQSADELDDCTATLMGHYFQCMHEIALLGVRGKIASEIENHSQKSVIFAHSFRHSEKPEIATRST